MAARINRRALAAGLLAATAAPHPRRHDDALRGDCMDARDALLNRIGDRLWSLFPDLYGPDGDHPAWALNSGMAPPAA